MASAHSTFRLLSFFHCCQNKWEWILKVWHDFDMNVFTLLASTAMLSFLKAPAGHDTVTGAIFDCFSCSWAASPCTCCISQSSPSSTLIYFLEFLSGVHQTQTPTADTYAPVPAVCLQRQLEKQGIWETIGGWGGCVGFWIWVFSELKFHGLFLDPCPGTGLVSRWHHTLVYCSWHKRSNELRIKGIWCRFVWRFEVAHEELRVVGIFKFDLVKRYLVDIFHLLNVICDCNKVSHLNA